MDDPQSFEISKPLTCNEFDNCQHVNMKKVLQKQKQKKKYIFLNFIFFLIFIFYLGYTTTLFIPENSFGYDYNTKRIFDGKFYFIFHKPTIVNKYQSEIFISNFVSLVQNNSLFNLTDYEYLDFLEVEIFYFINNPKKFDFCKKFIFEIWLDKINFNETNDDVLILNSKILNYTTTKTELLFKD